MEEILAELEGIVKTDFRDGEDGVTTVTIKTDLEDIRVLSRRLFFAFAGRQVALLELSLKKTDLEDIFLELTEQTAGAEDEGKEAEA